MPTDYRHVWHRIETPTWRPEIGIRKIGVGALFAFATLALSVVAFPLLLDKPVTSITAIAVSIRVFAANFLVMVLWSLIVALLLAAGGIVFLIGLAAILPIVGHATWHLYRKLVEP